MALVAHKYRWLRGKREARREQLLKQYGMTLRDYDALLKWQGGVCAICKRPEMERNQSLCVDHCHETGIVRGLLCVRCNQTCGRLEEDPDLAQNLAD